MIKLHNCKAEMLKLTVKCHFVFTHAYKHRICRKLEYIEDMTQMPGNVLGIVMRTYTCLRLKQNICPVHRKHA